MAKKKVAKPSSDHPQTDEPDAAERSAEVRSAADAVRRAEAELKKARQLYQDVRQQATEQLQAVREKTLGDVIDGVLGVVKKHPGPGVICAAVIGFFLGRLFRR